LYVYYDDGTSQQWVVANSFAGSTAYLPLTGGTVTGPVAFPAGSASTPSIIPAGDTNTGIFFPAADTIAFSEGGTEVMRINASGQIVSTGTIRIDKINSALDIRPGASDFSSVVWRSTDGLTTYANVGPEAVGSGSLWLNGATNIYLATGGTERARIDTSGNLQFNSGYGSVATAYGCRAWVNFNGTGTVAIRASGNVTSITDNGTGDYTVNLTTAMPDVNYCFTTASGQYVAANVPAMLGINRDNLTVTTTALRLYNITGAGALQDGANLYVAFFR
jgi:hypothetical protein